MLKLSSDVQPTVSVLLSLYNPDIEYLRMQLASINDQDYDTITLIVYNDNPTGKSLESFIRGIVTRFPVSYTHGKSNLGYVKAFEFLTVHSQGEYLVYCDQDDVWRKDRVSKAVCYLEKGYGLVTSDHSLINERGETVIQSVRKDSPKNFAMNWNTGDNITKQAAFTTFSIGMATAASREAVLSLVPFPAEIPHDRWISLGLSAMGPCAFIEDQLIQYRRHAKNASGLFTGISSKSDWRSKRTIPNLQVAMRFESMFPESDALPDIVRFAQACADRKRWQIVRYRSCAPLLALFELFASVVPNGFFSAVVTFLKKHLG